MYVWAIQILGSLFKCVVCAYYLSEYMLYIDELNDVFYF